MSQALTDSLRSHGRSDYRRGVPFSRSAAQSWQDGWLSEAHMSARAAQCREMAVAMQGLAAVDALEAARRVFTQCTVHRPTKHQQSIISEAGPLITHALERLHEALPRDNDDIQHEAVTAHAP